MSDLSVKYVNRYEISAEETVDMHRIFKKYYRNADIRTFKNDLDKKNGAFMVREKKTGRLVGFSTMLDMHMRINGRKIRGIFSGDTIIEEEYWGKNPLTTAIVLHVLKKMFLSPFTPFYWFLISKGYKTYLLLTNNFLNYYPRYDREDKKLESIAVSYCNYLFPDYYSEKKKIIDFGKEYQSLKGGVAEITADMCERFPKIAFFNQVNPTWDRGTELPCVGEVSWSFFAYRIFVKPVKKGVSSLFGILFPQREERAVPSQRKAF